MQSRIAVDQVPKPEADEIASVFIRAVERFFEDPKNRSDFEEWQKRQKND